MKVAVDIDKLLMEGQITEAEHARFRELAVRDTGTLSFNILVGFGVIATAGGALALLHSAAASLALGLILATAGFYLGARRVKEWGLLGSILLLVGTMTTGGAILALTHGGLAGLLIVTALCLAAGISARSSLLVAISVLLLAGTVGAATAYGHAMYELIIQRPTVTIVVFSLLAWGAYWLSLRLPLDYEPLALVFARTSLFLVNFGFWVGSLWGDSLGHDRDVWSSSGQLIHDWVFAIGWVIGLVGTGVWAVSRNRRWVVNLCSVFGAIHFYTQYFERLGASPTSMLVGGLVALGIAMTLVHYNQSFSPAGAEGAACADIIST